MPMLPSLAPVSQPLSHCRFTGKRGENKPPQDARIRPDLVSHPTSTLHETGPFDVIGDVHGCYDELIALLDKLGYTSDGEILPEEGMMSVPRYRHAEGRKPIFVGDYVDRGPKTPHVLTLVRDMLSMGLAFGVIGNHDDKLMRHLSPQNQTGIPANQVKVSPYMQGTLDQIEALPSPSLGRFKASVFSFLQSLPVHAIFDEGKLVVAHAGLEEKDHGQVSRAIRDFALYGKTTGEKDSEGRPVRLDWTVDYHGKATVIYGHTPYATVYERNGTFDVDTGCVFGGKLTAFRYPERTLVSVPAYKTYAEILGKLEPPAIS